MIALPPPDPAPAQARPLSAAIIDDRAAGLVRVVACGSWSAEQVSQHFVALAGTLSQCRSRGDEVRVLLDLRGADGQAPDARGRMEEWLGRIHRATDRVAILVSSSLRKAEMRQLPMLARRELFMSAAAAQNWLLA